ncbi:acyl-CoA dehydrogenase family protein [Methyloligella sp. 2.7D]|uniref:acyl-CoA dehydrogenase family protein n=1 Tax=unclassified Methyloligella TaxID=2625955 RepID=UPI00157DF14D|nr:acyl-CoA dehydrogenase family protein [Methyloligella sp. GL2]QKP76518.1 acyl-CoA dehydrogenase family protein [Methyloligella sp. GL2]
MAGETLDTPEDARLSDLVPLLKAAAEASAALGKKATEAMAARLAPSGKVDGAALERDEHAAHGLAWLETYVECIRQAASYAERMTEEGRFGEMESLLTQIGTGEYLAQIAGGVVMSQVEVIRLEELGLTDADRQEFLTDEVKTLIGANTPAARAKATGLIQDAHGNVTYGDTGLDEMTEAMREEMFRFSEAEVVPNAHEWHLKDEYIPMELISALAELGVFGLTIPEEFGGLGLGKEVMCVVSEELSRGYIGVGSLGTRSEIAAELILCGGTDAQKAEWLPKLASGEILPTAVFTEPNTGSDLASLTTRAKRDGDEYSITGQKTWITHAARADLMTVLTRTDPDQKGYRGLSMLLAPKPRGNDENPFPAEGMSGGEIEVLGYRGMKEFDISFDGFKVPAANLLGGEEGQGFKQLMQTFEAARIQTAARAIGVAQAALDLGLRYATERVQFGKPIINFPRISDKLVMMAAEISMVRQLTYFAAREKDADRRCDLEAGMAKLLAARIAWAAADNALQIHGGNGFALEYAISRVLCDARILNIFEGAAEIQAHVIARRLLES